MEFGKTLKTDVKQQAITLINYIYNFYLKPTF